MLLHTHVRQAAPRPTHLGSEPESEGREEGRAVRAEEDDPRVVGDEEGLLDVLLRARQRGLLQVVVVEVREVRAACWKGCK